MSDFDRDYAVEIHEPKLILIACEDHLSGTSYFKELKRCRDFESNKVRVEVLKRPKGKESCSAPIYQLENIQNFIDKYKLREDDEIWLVTDFDRFEPNIRKTIEAAEGIIPPVNFCISKPNFEFWIYLHVKDLPKDDHVEITKMQNDPKYFEKELKKLDGGYNKGNPKYRRFFSGTNAACERAKTYDPESVQDDVLPDLPYYTRIYRIIESMRFNKEYFEDDYNPTGFQR